LLAGAMKCQSMLVSLHQASMALQVSSVPLSETIEPGLPRREATLSRWYAFLPTNEQAEVFHQDRSKGAPGHARSRRGVTATSEQCSCRRHPPS
jgi:hypothetical protein